MSYTNNSMYRITPIVAATEAVAVFGILISTTLNVKHPHAVDKGSKGTKNPNTNLERKNRVDGVARRCLSGTTWPNIEFASNVVCSGQSTARVLLLLLLLRFSSYFPDDHTSLIYVDNGIWDENDSPVTTTISSTLVARAHPWSKIFDSLSMLPFFYQAA